MVRKFLLTTAYPGGIRVDSILQAAQEAGRQLVESGKMSPETLGVVQRGLVPLEMWARGVT
jgi:hypothetical protein